MPPGTTIRRRAVPMLALVLVAVGLCAPSAASAGSGFVSAWGWNVDSSNPGTGFELCHTSCQAGVAGGGPGQLKDPDGVAQDAAGYLYVADTSNQRIDKFTAAGAFVLAWGRNVNSANPGTGFETCTTSCQAGELGGGPGELNYPYGVASDAAGHLYVVDQGNERIDEFTTGGVFIRAWGKDVDAANPGTGFEICTSSCKVGGSGSGPGELVDPYNGVAVGRAGDVYVADFDNQRVAEYTGSGTFVRAWGKNVNPTNPGTGSEICTTSCQAGTSGAAAGEFYGPDGLAVDRAGNVYVTDYDNARVDKFTAAGAFVRAWGKNVNSATPSTGPETCTSSCQAGTDGGGAGEFSLPIAAASDPSGDLYVSERGNNRVQQFALNGSFVRAFGKNVDPTNPGTGFEVCTTACQAGMAGGGAGELSDPEGVTTDCRGAVYVADGSMNRINKFGDAAAPLPPCATPDTTRPVVSALTVHPASFKAARNGGSVGKSARKTGTTVRYRLSEAALVRFTVERQLSGRVAGKRCVRATRANRHHRRCSRSARLAGSFSDNGNRGTSRFHFTGRLRNRKLAIGLYNLVATPTDRAGNRGRAVRRRFRVLR